MIKNKFFLYYVLNKRLLKKASFLVVLLLIPVFTLLITLSAEQKSGIVHIALVAQDKNDAFSATLIEELSVPGKIVDYTLCDTEEDAQNLVRQGSVDAAWVILEDIQEGIEKIVQGKKAQLVRIYAAEDNVFVRASREKLFSTVFPHISYGVYQRFALPMTDQRSAEEYYNSFGDFGDIVELEFASQQVSNVDDASYLTSPLRGILASIMLLCGMAATLYFLTDDKRGVFSLMTPPQKCFVFLCNNLAALSISAVFVTVALLMSGSYTGFFRESVLMLFYVMASAVFCTLIGTFFNSPAKTVLMLPTVLILSLTLSPVFFNVKSFKFISLLLPPYYYLYGMGDMRYTAFLALYTLIAGAILWLKNRH